jgi:hypothetical protein
MTNTDDKIKLKVVDIIFDMYPELKKNKDEIMMNVLEKYGRPHKYILNKHIYNNQILYIDPDGLMFDNNLCYKGILYNDTYYLDEEKHNNININYFDKLMNYKNKR